MQNEISKKELHEAYCLEIITQDEYNWMIWMYLQLEERREVIKK